MLKCSHHSPTPLVVSVLISLFGSKMAWFSRYPYSLLQQRSGTLGSPGYFLFRLTPGDRDALGAEKVRSHPGRCRLPLLPWTRALLFWKLSNSSREHLSVYCSNEPQGLGSCPSKHREAHLIR